MSSWYPPGVTGSEPEIAGDAAWESICEEVSNKTRAEMITFLCKEHGTTADEYDDATEDDLIEAIATILYEQQLSDEAEAEMDYYSQEDD